MARIDQVLPKKIRKETIVQFGSGVFLRGFFDWMLQKLNDAGLYDGSAVVVQSTASGAGDLLARQNGQYTHITRGLDGVEVTPVDVISRCVKIQEEYGEYLKLAENLDLRVIVSNTTEAGIRLEPGDKWTDRPPASFPARLTQLLYRRHQLALPGFLILPCELIEKNGETLKRLVLECAREWELGEDFRRFVEEENRFCNTLVDRIVTGFPKGEKIDLGYGDELLNCSEPYHLWVIEGGRGFEEALPFHRLGVNVLWVDDLTPWRTRKVRILNGAHTAAVGMARLRGFATVKEAMDDPGMNTFLHKVVYDEIIPVLDMPREELTAYAEGVFRRFRNPYIRHEWRAISLYSLTKFRVRLLPVILAYEKRFGRPPEALLESLAGLIGMYRRLDVPDDEKIISAMRAPVREVLADEVLWGTDISRFAAAVEAHMDRGREAGA
jgi:tagaturonate reductase